MKIVCVGGGAASFFFAANVGEMISGADIYILEQGRTVLNKVRISGGGRCNVTHHCFVPEDLVENYPRGKNELLGPMYHFGPQNTVDWYQERGVELKVESDGRMFPVTDSSQTIIDCLERSCARNNVHIKTGVKVRNIAKAKDGFGYRIDVLKGDSITADVIFVAPGSSRPIWQVLGHLGHNIVAPVPSLFTFQIKDQRLKGLAGISVEDVEINVTGHKLQSSGPLLITHKGLSGPSVLKMSAFGARTFHELDYKFEVTVDFCPALSLKDVRRWRDEHGKKLLGNHQLIGLSKRLIKSLLDHAGLDAQKKYASLSNKELDKFAACLKQAKFHVTGQNTFKEEFVTAGGVDLREVDMGTFESKQYENMFFAGEVLNIDGVTGGFNFQAAWTGAMLAAIAVADRNKR